MGASPVPCPGHPPTILLPTLMQKVVLVLGSAQIPGTDPDLCPRSLCFKVRLEEVA